VLGSHDEACCGFQGPHVGHEVLPFATKAVDVIREKAEDFADGLMYAVAMLAQAHEGAGDFKKAGFARSSYKFDAYRGCTATNEQKLEWYIETAEDWLECVETGSAAQMLMKAHALVTKTLTPKLKLRFDTIYARVKDSERKFLEASMKYLDISHNVSAGISEADLHQTLEHAVTTAILANAGPNRSRLLRNLYADERTKNLRNYDMLEKMFKEQIVRPQDVQKFEKLLAEHQNASTKNGLTVLQNAIIEHNMFAASKIYNNIKFDELSRLLNITAKQAEDLASNMIEQRRMNGSIDQVQGIIEFAEEDASGTGTLSTWDGAVQDACQMVNAILDNLGKKYPQYSKF